MTYEEKVSARNLKCVDVRYWLQRIKWLLTNPYIKDIYLASNADERVIAQHRADLYRETWWQPKTEEKYSNKTSNKACQATEMWWESKTVDPSEHDDSQGSSLETLQTLSYIQEKNYTTLSVKVWKIEDSIYHISTRSI